jgi:hypothetical protein
MVSLNDGSIYKKVLKSKVLDTVMNSGTCDVYLQIKVLVKKVLKKVLMTRPQILQFNSQRLLPILINWVTQLPVNSNPALQAYSTSTRQISYYVFLGHASLRLLKLAFFQQHEL